ncbi:hypothetical protein MPSEU_001021000 [Mayamaea pseudoterrestris]|nr:hypothetical protein MPSEU_001021000 [Mayamaea pseudoterrestris]
MNRELYLFLFVFALFATYSGVEAFGATKSAMLLVPSQVLFQHSPPNCRTACLLHQSSPATSTAARDTEPMESKNTRRNRKKNQRKNKKRRQQSGEPQPLDEFATTSKVNETTAITENASATNASLSPILSTLLATADPVDQSNLIYPKSGDFPDVYWRSVSMEHLRMHPKFQPLPLPHDITRLDSLEDVKLFRQDSWQWDALHDGRCTTSQAVAALGFLEPLTGQILNVPRYWQRGGVGAFHRLRQPALRTLDKMNKVLRVHDNYDLNNQDCGKPLLWKRRNDRNSNGLFEYDYLYQTPESEIKRRQTSLRKLFQHQVSIKTIRMAWGNAQEATSLLTALNYFSERDPGFVMKETGMCGAGLDLNQTQSSLLVGASPDAILCHSNGSIEALEVKNHCPFVVPWIAKGKRRHKHRFNVADVPFDDHSKVFSHYIPQLMMEMLCLGPECRSVVLVRQTATNGALLLRLHRDDDWISDMIHFLERFQTEFVDKDEAPPQNFFWDDQDKLDKRENSRYRRFVNKTLEIRNSIQVIAHIPHHKVQRVAAAAPLFLD